MKKERIGVEAPAAVTLGAEQEAVAAPATALFQRLDRLHYGGRLTREGWIVRVHDFLEGASAVLVYERDGRVRGRVRPGGDAWGSTHHDCRVIFIITNLVDSNLLQLAAEKFPDVGFPVCAESCFTN
jgi:hypothetical protein